MEILQQSHTILYPHNWSFAMDRLVQIGRVCYGKDPTDEMVDDYEYVSKFITSRIKEGHDSILEHMSMSVVFTTDRGIANELVRHRIGSFMQESTRYVKSTEMKVIPSVEEPDMVNWTAAMATCEFAYRCAIDSGIKPEIARGRLPINLATRIVYTANMRQWRHVFKLRTSKFAHPDMRALLLPLLKKCAIFASPIFGDLYGGTDDN